MFNFREKLERIRKVKKDSLEFEAERFLRNGIEKLENLETERLKSIITLDFNYCKMGTVTEVITVSINENDCFMAKAYPYKTGREIFEKIKDLLIKDFTVDRIFCDEENLISIKF